MSIPSRLQEAGKKVRNRLKSRMHAKQRRLTSVMNANNRAIQGVFKPFKAAVDRAFMGEEMYPIKCEKCGSSDIAACVVGCGTYFCQACDFEKDLECDRTTENMAADLIFAFFNDALIENMPFIMETVNNGFSEGARIIFDRQGKRVRIPAVQDEGAIMALLNQQVETITTLKAQAAERSREIVIQGLEEGKSIPKIARQLKTEIPELVKWQGERIARTEIIRAHGDGMERTLKSAGVNSYQWIAQLDSRTCIICRTLHKHTFNMDLPVFEMFIRGNEAQREAQTKALISEGQYRPKPARTTHPNCRCVLVVDV